MRCCICTDHVIPGCDACIGTHRKCAYTSKPGMAFIRYHCAHPRAGEPGYIAYRHGVVLYPAEVSKCTPIVYVPFVRCPQAQKQGEWSVFDLTRKDKEIHHVCTTHLPGPSNYFVPLSPGQRAPNLPFVYVVRPSQSFALTDLSALVRKGSPNSTASNGP
jgi:hypothetical protein